MLTAATTSGARRPRAIRAAAVGRRRRPFPHPFPRSRRPGLDGAALEEGVKIVGQGPGAAVAPGRILLQALQADGFQIAGQLLLQARGGHRFGHAHHVQGVHGAVAAEGRPARQQVIEHRPQRVDVGGRGRPAACSPGLARGPCRRECRGRPRRPSGRRLAGAAWPDRSR